MEQLGGFLTLMLSIPVWMETVLVKAPFRVISFNIPLELKRIENEMKLR